MRWKDFADVEHDIIRLTGGSSLGICIFNPYGVLVWCGEGGNLPTNGNMYPVASHVNTRKNPWDSILQDLENGIILI